MAETFSQYYLEKVNKFEADRVALRQKEFGIWREWSWGASFDEVRAFTLGIMELGMQRGEHVVGIGDNDRQFLWGYLGVLSAGGAMIGLYTDANAKEAAYIVSHSDAVFILAQDQEQVDKMLEIRDEIPQVRNIIYWDESGLWEYDDPWLISYNEVREKGLARLKRSPNEFKEEVAKGKGEDLALICYTSGTTGLPKGAMLSHYALLKAADMFNRIDPRLETDNHVSFLPMGWIAEHILGIAGHCYYGNIINFPEEPETVREDLREIAPEFVVYGSRLWDGLVSMIQVRIQDATWINRQLYNIFMPIGNQVADKRLVGEPLGPWLGFLNWLGDKALFAPLRDQMGLANVRTALTGGSVLSPDVIRFFHGIGVNLKQIYGMTEVATTGTTHYNGDIKFASVGRPVPEVDIKINKRGEIQIAAPSMFTGYYKNPEKTAEDVIEEDGKRWFLTGDAGHIDEDGHLIYLDRLKDMIELSNGEKFSPQFIEGRLKFSPYVQDVMAVGGLTRDFVTALVIMEFGNVSRWAEKRGLGFTTFADLSQKQDVRDLVQEAVNGVNESLPPDGRIRAFILMPKEFDADEAEMTRSRKLKRVTLANKYSDLIEGMYSDAPIVTMRSEVTYQDGSTSQTENEVYVVRMS